MFNQRRYNYLRKRGYKIDTIINIKHIDDLFSRPPVVTKRTSQLIMRKGMSTRKLRFHRLNADELEKILLEKN